MRVACVRRGEGRFVTGSSQAPEGGASGVGIAKGVPPDLMTAAKTKQNPPTSTPSLMKA